MTSYQRRSDVITSHRHWYDVILMLFACWDASRETNSFLLEYIPCQKLGQPIRPSRSANRIIGYYRMYEWREKNRMILRTCAGWSESALFAYNRSHFLLDITQNPSNFYRNKYEVYHWRPRQVAVTFHCCIKHLDVSITTNFLRFLWCTLWMFVQMHQGGLCFC